MRPLELVREYLAALSRWDIDVLASFLHDEIRYHELPNRFAPNGNLRDKPALLAAAIQGRKLLKQQTFEILDCVESDDRVAVEVQWTGTLAVPFDSLPIDSQLRARSAMFFQVRDGKIVSQRNYDSVEPW